MTNFAEMYLTAKGEYDQARRAMECAKKHLLAAMDSAGTDELVIGDYVVTRSEVTRMSFDSKAFRNDFDDIYDAYKRPQTVHNFSVSFVA